MLGSPYHFGDVKVKLTVSSESFLTASRECFSHGQIVPISWRSWTFQLNNPIEVSAMHFYLGTTRGRVENEFAIKLANLNFATTPHICLAAARLMGSRGARDNDGGLDRRREQVRLRKKKERDARESFGAENALSTCRADDNECEVLLAAPAHSLDILIPLSPYDA